MSNYPHMRLGTNRMRGTQTVSDYIMYCRTHKTGTTHYRNVYITYCDTLMEEQLQHLAKKHV